MSQDETVLSLLPVVRGRNQAETRRVADKAYPFRCCAVCGLQMPACLQVAHLDHDAANNVPGNLAHLCPTHHGMYDAGLYPERKERCPVNLPVRWIMRAPFRLGSAVG